jgi:hypothetical protein
MYRNKDINVEKESKIIVFCSSFERNKKAILKKKPGLSSSEARDLFKNKFLGPLVNFLQYIHTK